MVRIRVLDVDGEAADVQAVLHSLAGVVPLGPLQHGGAPVGLLELAAGSATHAPPAAPSRRPRRSSLGKRAARRSRSPATPPPTAGSTAPVAAPASPAALPGVEDVSLAEDVGVRIDGDPPQVHLHRQGRGRHMHEFLLPPSPGKTLTATCSRKSGGGICGEQRTFRLR